VTTPYRQALVSFGRYRRDLEAGGEKSGDDGRATDREQMLARLRAFLDAQEIPVDWEAVGGHPENAIIDSLAMICPFEPNEKQALLEASGFDERCRVLTALAEMALAQHGQSGDLPLQ
jgi:Lon protease-like protein